MNSFKISLHMIHMNGPFDKEKLRYLISPSSVIYFLLLQYISFSNFVAFSKHFTCSVLYLSASLRLKYLPCWFRLPSELINVFEFYNAHAIEIGSSVTCPCCLGCISIQFFDDMSCSYIFMKLVLFLFYRWSLLLQTYVIQPQLQSLN